MAITLQNLKKIDQLFKESWQVYCSKIRTLLGIMAVLFVISVGGGFLIGFSKSIPVIILMLILILFVSLLITPSLIFATRDNIGVKESFKKAVKILSSYIWIVFLSGLITLGGFVLFIIPGILFSIWFSLAAYVLIFEGKRGIQALLRSKDLIAGKFWGVLWRFLMLGLIFVVFYFLIFFPSGLLMEITGHGEWIEPTGNILQSFLQFFVTPFFLVYSILIYQDLKNIKKEIPYQEPSKKRKIKYILIGAVVPLILIGLITGLITKLVLTF